MQGAPAQAAARDLRCTRTSLPPMKKGPPARRAQGEGGRVIQRNRRRGRRLGSFRAQRFGQPARAGQELFGDFSISVFLSKRTRSAAELPLEESMPRRTRYRRRRTSGSPRSRPHWRPSRSGPWSMTRPRSSAPERSSASTAPALRIKRGYVRPEDEPPIVPSDDGTVDGEADETGAGTASGPDTTSRLQWVGRPSRPSRPKRTRTCGRSPTGWSPSSPPTARWRCAMRFVNDPDVAFLAALHVLCLKLFNRKRFSDPTALTA